MNKRRRRRSSNSSRGERINNRDMNHSRQQQQGIDISHLFSNPNNEDGREYRNHYLHHLHNLL